MPSAHDDSVFSPSESPATRKALESVVKLVASILGRVDEYNTFVKTRDTMLRAMNDPNTTNHKEQYEQYQKSIPQWINALDQLLSGLYQAALADGRRSVDRS